MRHLTREDFLSFNLGASLDDYIIPGLNLIPKVRKLTERNSQNGTLAGHAFPFQSYETVVVVSYYFLMVYSKDKMKFTP